MIKRITNFMQRSKKLAEVITPPWMAPVYFGMRRMPQKHLFSGRYNKTNLLFRTVDYSAIREVLFDAEYEFLLKALEKKTDIKVVDLGAHIGLFSSWLFSSRPDAHVLSVEASPSTYLVLAKNIEFARREGRDWRGIHGAAWESRESVSFMDSGDAMSHKASTTGKVSVPGITLSDLLIDIPHVDLMKIDIEGAEEKFLCATPELLQKVEMLVVELHPKYCNTDRVMVLLQAEFPKLERMNDRQSSNPLLLCSRG